MSPLSIHDPPPPDRGVRGSFLRPALVSVDHLASPSVSPTAASVVWSVVFCSRRPSGPTTSSLTWGGGGNAEACLAEQGPHRPENVEYQRDLRHFAATDWSVTVGSVDVQPTDIVRNLGVLLDSELTRSSAIAGRPCDAKACQG